MDAEELMSSDFPQPPWAVEGLITEGFHTFAGREKTGKSFLTLQLAKAVSEGSSFLGRWPTVAGEVLYLALEDSPARIQKRLRMLLGEEGKPSDRLQIETEWGSSKSGGTQELEQWLKDTPTARLVVIDLMPVFDSESGSYRNESDKIHTLDDLAKKYGVAIVGVFHMIKGDASGSRPDWKARIQGSIGTSGAATGVMGLWRADLAVDGLLRATGKDIDEQAVPLHWEPGNAEGNVWSIRESEEPAPELPPNELSEKRARIVEVVSKHGWPVNPSGQREALPVGTAPMDVKRALDTPTKKANYNATRQLMYQMLSSNPPQLVWIERYYYTPEQAAALKAREPVDGQTAFRVVGSLAI